MSIKIDWSKFKKASGDKTHTVMRHEDGHELKVAHAHLSPKMRGELAKLKMETAKEEPQMMAMGGEVLKKENYSSGGMTMMTGNKEQDDEQERRRKASPDVGTQTQKGGIASPKPKEKTVNEKIGQPFADGGQVKADPKKKTLGETIGFPGFVDGGMAVEQGAPAAPVPTELEQTRSQYNIQQALASMSDPRRPFGMEAEVDPELMFSKVATDSPPSNFSTESWQKAQEVIANKKEMDKEAAMASDNQAREAQARAIAENQARLAAGLPPIPVPEAPGQAAPTPEAALMPSTPPQPASADATAEASKSLGMPSAADLTASGYKDQLSGIKDLAASQKTLGDEKAAIAARQKEFLERGMADFESARKELDAEVNAAIDDVKNKHIDPDHFWSNKSSFSKVATAIGIVLGGLGGGMTGKGDNMALNFIQKQIDADIDAQKAELGKAENLLSYNFKKYGNLREATEMTRAMQMGMVAADLDKAAAMAQGPEAAARAKMFGGQIKAQYAPIIEKQALTSTINKLQREAGKDPSKADALFTALERLDPKKAEDLRNRYVPGVGFAQTDADAKELKEIRGSTEAVRGDLKRLLDISKVTGKSVDLGLRAEADVIAKGLIGKLRLPLTGPGAMNEGERKMLEAIVANPTSIFSLDSSNRTKLKTLEKIMDTKASEAFKARGLTMPGKEATLSPQQQSFVAWAKKNPNNPKAKIVLEKLGLAE